MQRGIEEIQEKRYYGAKQVPCCEEERGLKAQRDGWLDEMYQRCLQEVLPIANDDVLKKRLLDLCEIRHFIYFHYADIFWAFQLQISLPT